MKTDFFFLAPVEVVKVTTKNLDEVAEWCGGKVAQTESRRVPGRLDSYVWVPTPKGTNISWAFPGMYITKRVVVTLKNELKATYSVFRRDYFEKNYFDTPDQAVEATWARKDGKKSVEKAQDQSIKKQVEEAVAEALKGAGVEPQVTQNSEEVVQKADGSYGAKSEVLSKQDGDVTVDVFVQTPAQQVGEVMKMSTDLVQAGVATEDEVSDMTYDVMKGLWLDFKNDVAEVAQEVDEDGKPIITG